VQGHVVVAQGNVFGKRIQAIISHGRFLYSRRKCRGQSPKPQSDEGKLMVHIKPNTLTVRFFDDNAAWGESYKAVATVQLLSDDTAYISGLMGEINRNDYRQLMRKLREEYAVTNVQWHRARADDLQATEQSTSAEKFVRCGIAEVRI
jgi:hypothetical protein